MLKFLFKLARSLLALRYQEVLMTKAELMRKVARLEFQNDQLVAEVTYVDELMRLIGFAEGLKTVKATAVEIVEHGYDDQEESED